jgi:predicted AlkP superfamily phosphohydrolase/phosphomutase
VAGQRGEEGIPPEDYENFRKKLIETLYQVTNEAGEPMVKQILTREEGFPGSQMRLAPDLTLILKDYGFISTLRSDVTVKPRPEPVGIHYPDGVFIAAGPGIQPGLSLPDLSIPDVTPTLLYSLGLLVPEDMEGHVPVEMFESDFIETYPVQIGEPTQPVETFQQPGVEEMDAKGKAAILRRLKALGYVD